MTSFNPVKSLSRGIKIAALAAFVICHSSFVLGAAPSAAVIAVEATRVADLILLRGGFDAGLRQGMICRITRGSLEVAEVIVVDLRSAHSAALIMNVAPKQSIRAGDLASIKILKT